MPLRFAHLADLHLDAPFRGVGPQDGRLQASLAEASLQAWDRAVDICLAEAVDFVAIAGDVYEQEEAGVRAQLRFLRGLERLSTAGIPAFVVHGNHDPQGGRWPAVRAWPPGVTVFGSDAVGTVAVEREGRILALVHGLSYPERHVSENLALRFRRREEPVYQVGLLHASVGEHPEHGRYAPCSLDDLRRSGLDYWALGHVHSREILSPAFPCAAYPGNLQARHPGEEGPRGLLLVQVEGAGPPRLAFRAADLWRFATLRLDLGRDPAASVDEVLARLQAEAEHRRDGRGLIARAELAGATALHPELRRPGTAEDLLRLLREEAPAGIGWDALEVRTRPEQDRAARMAAGDFVSDLLRAGEAGRAGAGDRLATLLGELRARPEFAALGEVVDWQALLADPERLWAQAEQLAVDLLEARAAEGP